MMKNQLGSSRMDTVLKMLLIAFVSLLAFSTGVYFGKEMVEQDYQYKALESDFKHATTAEAKTPEDAINEEEVATLAEKYTNAEKEDLAEVAQRAAHGEDVAAHGEKRNVASAHDDHAAPAAKAAPAHDDHHAAPAHDDHAAPAPKAAAAHAAPAPKAAAHDDHHAAPAPKAAAAHDDHHAAPAPKPAAAHDDHHAAPAPKAAAAHSAKPDLSAAHKAAERVANNAAPVSEPKHHVDENRVPTSLPKTVGGKGMVEFTVQVASYPTADAAKSHANDLVKKGFPAFPVEAVVNGRSWYRVSVGSFKSQKEATAYRTTLLKQADLQSAIVQKIQR
ncbi:MAG: SPOR domain-containing protein [Bdellovibrionota bacterium]